MIAVAARLKCSSSSTHYNHDQRRNEQPFLRERIPTPELMRWRLYSSAIEAHPFGWYFAFDLLVKL